MNFEILLLISLIIGILVPIIGIFGTSFFAKDIEKFVNIIENPLKTVLLKKWGIIKVSIFLLALFLTCSCFIGYIGFIDKDETLQIKISEIGTTNSSDIYWISASVLSGRFLPQVQIFIFDYNNDSILIEHLSTGESGGIDLKIPSQYNKSFNLIAIYHDVKIKQKYSNGTQLMKSQNILDSTSKIIPFVFLAFGMTILTFILFIYPFYKQLKIY